MYFSRVLHYFESESISSHEYEPAVSNQLLGPGKMGSIRCELLGHSLVTFRPFVGNYQGPFVGFYQDPFVGQKIIEHNQSATVVKALDYLKSSFKYSKYVGLNKMSYHTYLRSVLLQTYCCEVLPIWFIFSLYPPKRQFRSISLFTVLSEG